MTLLQLLILIFYREALGALQRLPRFLSQLVQIHCAPNLSVIVYCVRLKNYSRATTLVNAEENSPPRRFAPPAVPAAAR